MSSIDKFGRIYEVGSLVVRAYNKGWLYDCKVTKIIGDKIYLDHSSQPLRYPSRCMILPPNYNDVNLWKNIISP